MILKKLSVIALSIFVFGVFQNCTKSDENNNTAKVQLKLVDAPGDYLEVNVEIVDIQYNSSEDEEGWVSFTPENGYPIQVDLTQLIAGNSLLLTDQVISSGMLKQIRLILSDNNTITYLDDDNEPVTTHLDTPSAQQSGLKLKINTELEPGFSYTFILDWDVQKSIVKAGNSGKFNLKPVIRVNTEVNSGSVMGIITGDVDGDEIDAVPLAGVNVGIYTLDNVYITGSLTNENGNFIIQGLDAGEYKISIEHYGFDPYNSSDTILVEVGTVLDLGTIELLETTS
ncbi:DUF4382 domain-containing protein [Aureibaculum algae]|uniref:DUF4382 domain-containing protein n=1 Tax=Aureibaculum algae TaxID=2584122 RepID=A0A5B7TUL3_9FLAO|nr:DUF4382 domain-containing protein [Aureibaculum algae]QCX39011.1 DUF4382 domain-containing protein [Aureibaculum algae]